MVRNNIEEFKDFQFISYSVRIVCASVSDRWQGDNLFSFCAEALPGARSDGHCFCKCFATLETQ